MEIKLTKQAIARFWAKVNIQGPDDCWNWKVYINAYGYGQFHLNGTPYLAHRLSWELTYGPIPKGLCCCHRCDNRKCVNPSHLFLGTHKDNTQDMISKNRSSHGINNGINNGRATLTEEQVIEIRRLYALENHLSQVKLGILFGVSDSQIDNIVQRKSWKHI
jgi:hypothetical protein